MAREQYVFSWIVCLLWSSLTIVRHVKLCVPPRGWHFHARRPWQWKLVNVYGYVPIIIDLQLSHKMLQAVLNKQESDKNILIWKPSGERECKLK